MELCERFDLRFVIITDRFVNTLKEKYDSKQISKVNFQGLCDTAVDWQTKKPISDSEKALIRKRDVKTIEKYIVVNKLDEIAFDRTVEEIKYRYYEVAIALLLYRKQTDHPYLKF